MLFHITTRHEWQQATIAGVLAPSTLAEVGFVHLSTEEQWPRTAARFFAGRSDLVLLTIDPSRLRAELRYERADGEEFPHLYGTLEASAVTRVEVLALDERDVPCVRASFR